MTNDQIEALRIAARRAVLYLAARLIEDEDDLVMLAIGRASGPEGQAYNDTSYAKPIERLEVEIDEELADAIFYAHLLILRRAADLP